LSRTTCPARLVAEIPNKPISVAVSKPRPNKKPTGNMCQDRETRPKTGRNIRTSGPDAEWNASRSSFTNFSPRRNRENADHKLLSMRKFIPPITSKNSAETAVRTTLTLLKSFTCRVSAVPEMAMDAPITMLECPNAKNNPTEYECLFSCNNFRTTLSMAAMWSGSKAWRRPNM
jgi:hypothetical protein